MALSVCSGLGCLPRRGSLVPGWAKLRVSQTLDPLQSLTKQELDAGQGGTHGLGRGIDPPPAPPPNFFRWLLRKQSTPAVRAHILLVTF